ncbi:Hypothetical predicted protein [Podarcis lilfordi]|uniref:Uncharacterized protein n=1 Tax=Podarcis lilfordi TaxID=74358 RepID=A0AA35LDK2_9SAUR|nr:Hypothetical predicted protein [Podarcis lilfordi]
MRRARLALAGIPDRGLLSFLQQESPHRRPRDSAPSFAHHNPLLARFLIIIISTPVVDPLLPTLLLGWGQN